MPRQIYPGQSKFHSQHEEAKLAKRKADARLRMAKLRQKSKEEINHIVNEEKEKVEQAKQSKRRADIRLNVAKLRQHQSDEQVTKTNLLKTQWREKQKQQQNIANTFAEQRMMQYASERYIISLYDVVTNSTDYCL